MKSNAILCISIAALFGVAGCSGPSSAELKEAEEQCAKFYKEQRAKSYEHVKAIDHWMKNGKLVIELAHMKSPDANTYKSNVCLYDKEKGTIEIPGIFEQSRWAK